MPTSRISNHMKIESKSRRLLVREKLLRVSIWASTNLLRKFIWVSSNDADLIFHSRRTAKYVVMIPCNSDDEVDDSWIHTSHHQFKHESTGLCIGKLWFMLKITNLSRLNFFFQIVRTWIRIMFMLPFMIPMQRLKNGSSRRTIKIGTDKDRFVCYLLQLVD